MGILTFIFWCVVIFYVLGLAGRLLLRWFIRRKQREFESRVEEYQRGQSRQGRHEGDVTVEQMEIKERHVNTKVGEYIDFEEVEEVKDTRQ